VNKASTFSFDGITGSVSSEVDREVGAGQSSYFFFLHTDATSYGDTAFFDLTATGQPGISASFDTYAPAVPEAESYLTLVQNRI